MKTITILSGADRVGKSTLASSLEKPGVCRVKHFGPPPSDRPLFSDVREEIADWQMSGEPQLVLDRSYVCSYCMNQPDVLDAILEFEWDHRHLDIRHLGVWESWQVVARRHVDEIQALGIKNHVEEYKERMEIHQSYYEKLEDFYDFVTMFPSKWSSSRTGT